MPFGFSGAPPNFQKAIDIILKPVIGRFVWVYMDDVIITSPSFNEHLDHLNQVLTLLQNAGLTLNKENCHFKRDKLKYLGLIISKEVIETNNSKVKAIAEMKPPKNKAPVLQLSNFTGQFNLFTDASGVEIGAVLNQNRRSIAFASRTLNKAERNYTVTERECLALLWALNKFKTYFGSLSVKVITDHAAFTKLTNGKNLFNLMIRWALKLSEFYIEWGHRPGVQHFVADVLSRNRVGNMDGSQISYAALRALALKSREQLIREQREDPELGHIYRYLENPDDGYVNATVCEGWSQDFKIIDGLLFYAKYSTTLGELRVYIPRSLHEAIMQEFQDLPLACHLGNRKTYLKLRDTYLLGPYPASRPERYRFLLVITDHFTKWSELILLRKASAQAIANALFENYISRYGATISLISDNGPQFISEVEGKRVTVNIDQVRVYHPRQYDTISLDSHVETLYEGQRSSNGSSRSHPGKLKGSRTASSEENNGCKSNKGNAGWEDPRLKHKVRSNGSVDRKDLKRSKICRKRSLKGYEHRNQKRPTPEPKQGIKRLIPSSVSSRNYKYRRPNNPSQGSQSIAGFSHQRDNRQGKPPTEGAKQERWTIRQGPETRTTKSGTNRAAERRTVRSKQATAVRPCSYYLCSRVKQPEGIPEERRSIGIDSIPQKNIRRSSLRMEALNGDPVDRSE
ncbi:retrovirus-related Pol polyprotein from transposon 17.6 [Trichonephila clavipes]|nr:retrovirus-related Pol polyprotein from transposon 17.6 [Trichonephila clavipes]